jgi:hypothetical protein
VLPLRARARRAPADVRAPSSRLGARDSCPVARTLAADERGRGGPIGWALGRSRFGERPNDSFASRRARSGLLAAAYLGRLVHRSSPLGVSLAWPA